MTSLLLVNLLQMGGGLAALVCLLGLLHLQERWVGRYLSHRFGWRAVLVTGWLGVPIHELSHWLLAHLFSHRIIAWRLFDPDPVSGTLGYVRHAYSRRSAWQLMGTFFIGVSPPLLGGALLLCLLRWMLPDQALPPLVERAVALSSESDLRAMALGGAGLVLKLAATFWEQRSALLALQLYFGVCIASHMAPSPADLVGALPGAALLTSLLSGAAVALSLAGHHLAITSALIAPLTLLYLMVLFFQTLSLAAVFLLGRITGYPGEARLITR